MREFDREWLGRVRHERQPDRLDQLRVGDIIRWNGRLRTIRAITRYPSGAIHSVSFVKVHRSGYPSPMTVYYRAELAKAFGGIVARRKDGPMLCATDLECAVSRDIANARYGNEARVTESETVGVIW